MVQRRMAGGAIATRLWSGRTTASSRTMSGAPHSPGPVIGGNEGAGASAAGRGRRCRGGREPAGGRRRRLGLGRFLRRGGGGGRTRARHRHALRGREIAGG